MGINGFQNIETSSQSFLSGMLGFDEFDSGDCDETTEEDLRVKLPLFILISSDFER